MGWQILKFLVLIFIFSRLTHQQETTPEERCRTIGNGYICLDCFRTGTCVNGVIETITLCPSTTSGQSYCDDSINTNYGSCAPLPESSTKCSCFSSTQCIADPNDPTVVLHCESEPPISDPPCNSASGIDLTNCGCASCSADCPLLDDPNDDCASYFACSGNDLIPRSCSYGCFNQALCSCAERGSTTTSTIPTISPECSLIDDPNDDCSKLFYYDGTVLTPLECPDNQCFDQSLCGCVGQSTSTTTTTSNPNCDIFFDEPNDDCSIYYYFDGTTLIPLTCADSYCFDNVSCSCTASKESTTISSSITTTTATTTTTAATTTTTTATTTTTDTTTSGICPTDCPYIEDTNDTCGKFYICDDGVWYPSECPGVLCFNQASCKCL